MTLPAQEPLLTARTNVTGHGAPLVLVPGGLTGWRSWMPHAERLARDWRVIRTQLLSVDLGLQGVPLPPDYSLRTESRALARALDALGVQGADFVAWSYGAEITLDFALDHPERIHSLTLIEPPAFWVLRESGRLDAETQAFLRDKASYGPEEVTEDQLERFLVGAGLVPDGVDARSLPQWPVWVEHRQSLRTGDAESRHEDYLERLRHLGRPVLLFKGEGSPAHMREIVDVLGQELPNARTEELPGAHALHLVSIDRFLGILGNFLAGQDRGTARSQASDT